MLSMPQVRPEVFEGLAESLTSHAFRPQSCWLSSGSLGAGAEQKKYTRIPSPGIKVHYAGTHPPHHLAVPDSDTPDTAQLGPTTQLSELIELACRWNKSFGIDLGNVEIRVLLKEPSNVQRYSE